MNVWILKALARNIFTSNMNENLVSNTNHTDFFSSLKEMGQAKTTKTYPISLLSLAFHMHLRMTTSACIADAYMLHENLTTGQLPPNSRK